MTEPVQEQSRTLRHCLTNEIRSVTDEPVHAKVEHFFDLRQFVYCPHNHLDAQAVRFFQFGFGFVSNPQ
jgi:hypothetical protein